MASAWKPPPGQIMAAVPLAVDGCGRKAVRVGCVTLRTDLKLIGGGAKISCSCWFQSSDPGGSPGQRGITSGWSTIDICFAPLMFDCSGVPAPHHVSKMRPLPHVLSGNHTRVSWMVVPAHESRRPCSNREPGLLPVLIDLPAH